MKEAEDVRNLFSLFRGKKPDQYREVHEGERDEQRQAGLADRWPVFKQQPMPDVRGSAEVAVVPQPARSVSAPPMPRVADKPDLGVSGPSASAASAGELQALFGRLRGEAPIAPPAGPGPDATTDVAPPAGSIRSLFARLGQS